MPEHARAVQFVSRMDFVLFGDLIRVATNWKYNIVAKRCTERDTNVAKWDAHTGSFDHQNFYLTSWSFYVLINAYFLHMYDIRMMETGVGFIHAIKSAIISAMWACQCWSLLWLKMELAPRSVWFWCMCIACARCVSFRFLKFLNLLHWLSQVASSCAIFSRKVLIAPGGGYHGLAWSKEGLDVAALYNSFGVSAFVLKYRCDCARVKQRVR